MASDIQIESTATGLNLPAVVDTDAADESMASGIQIKTTAQIESIARGFNLPAAVDTDATDSAAKLQNLPLPTVSTDITGGHYCVPQVDVSMFFSAKTRKRNMTEADETDKLKLKHKPIEMVRHGTTQLSAILGENKQHTVSGTVHKSGRMRIKKKDKDFKF